MSNLRIRFATWRVRFAESLDTLHRQATPNRVGRARFPSTSPATSPCSSAKTPSMVVDGLLNVTYCDERRALVPVARFMERLDERPGKGDLWRKPATHSD